jgi:hypothetical protein
MILSREFCQYTITGRLGKRPARFFRVFFSDPDHELPLVTNDNKRTIIWPGPKTMEVEDYPFLIRISGWFARKFDRQVGETIFTMLKQDCPLR